MARRNFDEAFLRKLDNLAIVSRRVAAGRAKGERRSPRKGAGVEFQDYREYVAGDDLRYVDWNIYGRLDRLLLKLFIEEEDLCLHLLVDGSGSMGVGQPPKLDFALQVAAALGYISLNNLERVALAHFAGEIARMLRPRRGRGQIVPMLEFLAEIPAAGSTNLNACLANYALRAQTGGVAVVLSDLLDPAGYAEGLRALLRRRFEVFVLHVVSQEELDPPLRGDVTLVDVEGGPSRQVSIDRAALDGYQARLQAHFSEAEGFCARHRIDYMRTSTAVPFEDLILRHLRRGGFLR
jgi:uncharacterized protein (DUF58 family)